LTALFVFNGAIDGLDRRLYDYAKAAERAIAHRAGAFMTK
jgi:hypothetical protein